MSEFYAVIQRESFAKTFLFLLILCTVFGSIIPLLSNIRFFTYHSAGKDTKKYLTMQGVAVVWGILWMFLCVFAWYSYGVLMVLAGESPINNLLITAGKKETISSKNG